MEPMVYRCLVSIFRRPLAGVIIGYCPRRTAASTKPRSPQSAATLALAKQAQVRAPPSSKKGCQAGPNDASWPTHPCGDTATKGWSWPNSWANSAPFSPATLIAQSDLSLVGSMLTMEALWWY